ncbi:MAG: hypothetical protein OXG55_15875 [bacterium]|nr:hypothetical protein [bacterium]
MRIERLDVFAFPVPFRVVFRHASASRARAENLIIAARSDCGRVGYGEGCPRSYVTAETVPGAVDFVRGVTESIIGAVTDAASLRDWAEDHRRLIDRNPAAFCAVELAILDLIGNVTRRPVEDVVGAPRLSGCFSYSAVLGDAPPLAYRWQFHRYWKRGFRDFKVKVSGDPERDRAKMRVFRNRSDPSLRVRLDANNRWTSVEECVGHITAMGRGISAVEEPLQAGDLDGFARVGEECGARIILDESITRVEQLERLDDPARWIVNVRVSKMGGIIRSLHLASEAAGRGLGIIVGAQVGETSLLTRAGLAVMNAVGDRLVAAEGAFGTHLLQQDLTGSCLMFGDGGVLDSEDVDACAAGLGLRVRAEQLVAV